MQPKTVCRLLFLVGCLLGLGCQPADEPTPTSATGEPAESAAAQEHEVESPAASPTSAAISVQVRDWNAVLELVASHRGKVVVVDLWSTDCLPCVTEFPNLVKLHREHVADVACISVNCDYIGLEQSPPESYRENVLQFLRKQQATFDNVISSVESDRLFEMIELASIPAVYVYDQTGQLKKRFDNDDAAYGDGFTYQKQVIPLVETLLSASAPVSGSSDASDRQ